MGIRTFQIYLSERSEMSSSWIRVALNPTMSVLRRDGRRDTDTEEKPHEDGSRDGKDAATILEPQMLEDAGRTVRLESQEEVWP